MSGSPLERATARLGEASRARRRELGLSLDVLAERVACSKSYLSAIENARCGPPSAAILRRLEAALNTEPGHLTRLADLQATPGPIRRELQELQRRQLAAARVASLLREARGASGGSPGLDAAYQSGELRTLIDRLSPPGEQGPTPVALPLEVPVINRVQAGYPREFTDLGYPARVADEYVRCPDLSDADAFAARVVGDSMQPDYREGDIVVFSPARDIRNGSDCFARLAPDDETTFKRVFFESGPASEELIRLQPLNQSYAPRTLPREQVVGLYAAVSVQRPIG
ncbi:MAG: helix-turn-helix domain-containing protein [Planctomycetota bacterium]|nr:MAG: helix-turn-helix domain-containing protein [Planctomycetota bacterium]